MGCVNRTAEQYKLVFRMEATFDVPTLCFKDVLRMTILLSDPDCVIFGSLSQCNLLFI